MLRTYAINSIDYFKTSLSFDDDLVVSCRDSNRLLTSLIENVKCSKTGGLGHQISQLNTAFSFVPRAITQVYHYDCICTLFD